jgi:hypothetical protein
MRTTIPLLIGAFALLAPLPTHAGETNAWTFDVSLYGLAAGMSGTIGIGRANADVDVGFNQVLENLEFGAMGSVRVGYGPFALTTDVIYMGLQATKKDVTAEFDQWLVEPTFSYRVCNYCEVLGGVRYNNLSGEVRGLGGVVGPTPTGTQDWWDPILGTNLKLPLGKAFSLNVRGDVGGFGVSSDFTWQAYPFFSWQFNQWGSIQLGYRWLAIDYETGSGSSRFKYDMLVQGPQLGFTVHF